MNHLQKDFKKIIKKNVFREIQIFNDDFFILKLVGTLQDTKCALFDIIDQECIGGSD